MRIASSSEMKRLSIYPLHMYVGTNCPREYISRNKRARERGFPTKYVELEWRRRANIFIAPPRPLWQAVPIFYIDVLVGGV